MGTRIRSVASHLSRVHDDMKGVSALPKPKSQFRNVWWDERNPHWIAEVYVKNNRVRVGRFEKEEDAGEAARLARLYLEAGGDPETLRSPRFKAIRAAKQKKRSRRLMTLHQNLANREKTGKSTKAVAYAIRRMKTGRQSKATGVITGIEAPAGF